VYNHCVRVAWIKCERKKKKDSDIPFEIVDVDQKKEEKRGLELGAAFR
jgi:hypothetical protein